MPAALENTVAKEALGVIPPKKPLGELELLDEASADAG